MSEALFERPPLRTIAPPTKTHRVRRSASLSNSKALLLGESFGASTGQGWVLEKGTRLAVAVWVTAMPKAR